MKILKLIALSGAKHSKKDSVASRLAQNSDCIWIKPYTDREIIGDDWYISMSKTKLNRKMEREVPLAETVVAGNRYVFFENQLKGDFVVLIGDDRIIYNLKKNWGGHLITVKCHSKDEKPSPRCLMDDKEFDIVFNYETDDFDSLVFEIEDMYDYQVK